jgi:hypothetical protein
MSGAGRTHLIIAGLLADAIIMLPVTSDEPSRGQAACCPRGV